MARTYFVTGTDTDAGKTFITCGLLEAVNQKGLQSLALKPVAAGSDEAAEGRTNDDAVKLMDAMSVELSYAQVNPILFDPPIAPHIAAREVDRLITLDRLEGISRGALMKKHDVSFIEGAGGWRVPLNDREMLSDLAVKMNTPVILVVGMKLGCISHGLLTAESIVRSGCRLAGWVANRVDPNMSRFDENVQTLKDMIPAPCLGVVPWHENASAVDVAGYLDISVLVQGS